MKVTHEDLAANVDVANSYNFVTGRSDPSRSDSDGGRTPDDHGTSVAGIIGAVGFNGKGGRGVAFNARLRGYNLLVTPDISSNVANMAKALGSDPISADNDLFNASFGRGGVLLLPFTRAYQALTQTSLTLRNGLGAVIVNSAGNYFQIMGDENADKASACKPANALGVSCSDISTDERLGGTAPRCCWRYRGRW